MHDDEYPHTSSIIDSSEYGLFRREDVVEHPLCEDSWQDSPPLPREKKERSFFGIDKNISVALLGSLCVVSVSIFLGVVLRVQNNPLFVAQNATNTPEQRRTPPSTPNPFASITTEGVSVLVYDVKTKKVLYEKHADEERPLASLTKLMTSLVALETAPKDTRVVVTQNAIDTSGDSGLLVNESWKLSDLVSFTLMTSSNDGADALASAIGGFGKMQGEKDSAGSAYVDTFVEKMNARAQEMGLAHTRFQNPTGLDEGRGGEGGVGTAQDVAHLLAYVWHRVPDTSADTVYANKVFTSESGISHYATNTNTEVASIPGLLLSKTGFTNLAGGNLAVLFDAGLNHPIAIVVLGSTRDGRFSDVRTLIDATYAYIQSGWFVYEEQ